MIYPFNLLTMGRRASKPENPYADMYPRALAAALDMMVLFVLLRHYFDWMDTQYFPLLGPDFVERYRAASSAQERAPMVAQWLTRGVIQVMIFGVLIVGCQSFSGTTPGKWLVGLKIVRAKTHAPLSTWRFALRC